MWDRMSLEDCKQANNNLIYILKDHYMDIVYKMDCKRSVLMG